MRIRCVCLFALILFTIACNEHQVDLVVHNAKIITMDDDQPTATAMAVNQGKLVSLGPSQAILNQFSAKAYWDAKGQTITPGLIDAHAHFYQLGLGLLEVDLRGTTSKQAVIDRLLGFEPYKNATYVVARGWDQNDWDDSSWPSKADLDAYFPDTPVALQRVDGHALWVNSKALSLAGIENAGPVPGGLIRAGEDGTPSGILIDAPCDLVMATIPEPTTEISTRALIDAQATCFSLGLTGVHDAGLSREIIELIDSLHGIDALRIKIDAMVSNQEPDVTHFLESGLIDKQRLRVGSIKVYADGALGSRGAALRAEYSDEPGHFGAIITSISDLESLAKRALKAGFQVNTHAIGDSANVSVLRVYERLLKQTENRRWRIEHAQVVPPDYIPFFSKNIIPSVQPTHATSDMYWAEQRLGAHRMQGAYAYASLLSESGVLPLGTDFPVEYVNPMLTLYAAVSRKDVQGYPNSGFYPDEALTRMEALKGMTQWAAYANFTEDRRGSLTPGKEADFIVLDKNPMECALSEIPGIKVIRTYVDGVKVYGAD